MIFSKTIKNIRSHKESYDPMSSQQVQQKSQKAEQDSEESGEENNKMYSAPMIQKKNIHKVIVVGGSTATKQYPLQLTKSTSGLAIVPRDKGPINRAQTYGIYLRNLNQKVGEQDIVKLIGSKELLGIKISNKTGEVNFSTEEAAEEALENLNEKSLFGNVIKAMAQYKQQREIKTNEPQKQTLPLQAPREIKIQKRQEQPSNLRMDQKDSIFNRIQFKKN